MSTEKIINLTPHAVTLADDDGRVIMTIPPSGNVARVVTVPKIVSFLHGVPIVQTVFGEVVGLPEQEPGVYYVTSTLVAQAVRRPDVLSPDTGPTAIRQDGQVVAVRRLQCFGE